VRTAEGYWSTPWSEEEVSYLREFYEAKPAKEIAEHLGRSVNAVRLRARIEGLKSRHRAGVNSLVRDYFRTIDTPMKAYVLGLLTADAYVSRAGQLVLALHEKDRELVELVRDQVAPAARINTYTSRTSPMARFTISSPELVGDLARHGVVRAKSLITTWPDALPPDLEGSYVCGYFDGDGSLRARPPYRWAVVSGSPQFLTEMQVKIGERIGVRAGGPYRDRRHRACWSLVQTGEPVREIDAWLHRDVPGLARKRLSGEQALQNS
jgi:hypothetical protein